MKHNRKKYFASRLAVESLTYRCYRARPSLFPSWSNPVYWSYPSLLLSFDFDGLFDLFFDFFVKTSIIRGE